MDQFQLCLKPGFVDSDEAGDLISDTPPAVKGGNTICDSVVPIKTCSNGQTEGINNDQVNAMSYSSCPESFGHKFITPGQYRRMRCVLERHLVS